MVHTHMHRCGCANPRHRCAMGTWFHVPFSGVLAWCVRRSVCQNKSPSSSLVVETASPKGVSGKTAFGNKKWNIVWFGVNTGPGERPVQRPEHGAVPVPEKQGEEAQPRSQSLLSQSARVWQARPSSLGQTGMLGVVISLL